jgi:hypothetical protein
MTRIVSSQKGWDMGRSYGFHMWFVRVLSMKLIELAQRREQWRIMKYMAINKRLGSADVGELLSFMIEL